MDNTSNKQKVSTPASNSTPTASTTPVENKTPAQPPVDDTVTKLREEYSKLQGQNELLIQQVQLTKQSQMQKPAEQQTPAPAEYPEPSLAETNPQEYNRRAQAYLDSVVAKRVQETLNTTFTKNREQESLNKVNSYIQGNYGPELAKGLQSPLVAKATSFFMDMGITAPQGTLEYARAMETALDRASKYMTEEKLTSFQKATIDEDNRQRAVDNHGPSQSTVLKDNPNLPELTEDEVRINRKWGIDPAKVRQSKARLLQVE